MAVDPKISVTAVHGSIAAFADISNLVSNTIDSWQSRTDNLETWRLSPETIEAINDSRAGKVEGIEDFDTFITSIE